MNQTPDGYFDMDCPCKGKNLDRLLQPAILLALSEGEMHGFAIINAIGHGAVCGGNAPDATGVYRYLKRMEESGLLASRWVTDDAGDKPRRLYSITPHGRHCRDNWAAVLKPYAAAIDTLSNQLTQISEKENLA